MFSVVDGSRVDPFVSVDETWTVGEIPGGGKVDVGAPAKGVSWAQDRNGHLIAAEKMTRAHGDR